MTDVQLSLGCRSGGCSKRCWLVSAVDHIAVGLGAGREGDAEVNV